MENTRAIESDDFLAEFSSVLGSLPGKTTAEPVQGPGGARSPSRQKQKIAAEFAVPVLRALSSDMKRPESTASINLGSVLFFDIF